MKQMLIVRYYLYLLERFHPAQFAFLSALIAATLLVGVSVIGSTKFSFSTLPIAASALFLFLLRLRIFDEFKDHAHDTLHYPERPLPRGLLNKNELYFMLVLVFAGEITLIFMGGPWTIPVFFCAFGYSLLMYEEFFLRMWLRKRFTLYVISHELLVIPFFAYIASFAVRDLSLFFTEAFTALLMFTGMQLFLLEVARKIRVKEHEVASRDTYTAQYGIHGAGILLFCAAFTSITGLALFEYVITGHIGMNSLFGYAILIALPVPISIFMHDPSTRNVKRLFAAAICFFAVTHVGFIVSASLFLI